MFRKIQILIITSLISSFCLVTNSYAGACRDDAVATATTAHLSEEDSDEEGNDDGISDDGLTVYDKKTDLTWQRCLVGRSWDGSTCAGGPTAMNWQSALSVGDSGWRLPNIKELASIVEQQCHGPALNSIAFPRSTTNIWSSSPYAGSDDAAWMISFNYGHTNHLSHKNYSNIYVRLVRSGRLEPIIDLQ